MARKIVLLLATMLAAAGTSSALAGVMYQLEGGICTDGTRTDPGGALLCSHNVTVTAQMIDGYVPGTPFVDSSSGASTVAFFTFSDGFITVATDFPPGGSGSGNFGVMLSFPAVIGHQHQRGIMKG